MRRPIGRVPIATRNSPAFQVQTAMLDIKTALTFVLFYAALDCVVWLLIWRTQRQLAGVGAIAGGYVLFALGLLLFPYRAPLGIVIANTLINVAQIQLADGFGQFLGQPRWRYAAGAVLIASLVFWTGAMIWFPDESAARIIASCVIALVAFVHMMRTLLRDRSQPRLLRIFTGLGVGLHIAVTTARLVDAAIDPSADIMRSPLQAWYLFEVGAITNFLFFCLLVMVGVRLARDLHRRNQELSREVTQRRSLQDKLSLTLETEVQLRSKQRQVLHIVSHEFRAPLAVIDHAADMIGAMLRRPDQAMDQKLWSIRDSVRRLLRLIDQLVVGDRVDERVMRWDRVAVRDLLTTICRSFGDTEPGGRLQLHIPQEPVWLTADRELMLAALGNVIDNALKYSPPEAPVFISFRREADELEIVVKDRGVGIPDAEIGRVGERFFRASNSKNVPGTGLGLYTVRRLLEYHRGRLELSRASDGGTLAVIKLPLEPAETAALAS